MSPFSGWWKTWHGSLLPNCRKTNTTCSGKEGVKRLAEEMRMPLLGQIPIVQSICENGDNGTPEVLNDGSQTGQAFMAFARRVVEETGRRNAEQAPTKIVEVKK